MTVRFHKIHAKNVSRKRILPTTRRKTASPLVTQNSREKYMMDLLHLGKSKSSSPVIFLNMTLKARRCRRYDQEDVCVYPGDANRRKILMRTDDCVDEEKYRGKGMV